MGEQTITVSRPAQTAYPLAGRYDVIVIGGGFSGVSAAVAASRMGRKVLLLEKRIMPGGLATAGIITHYLALCDGHGRKVISGQAEELLYTAIQYSYDTLSDDWRGGPAYLEHPTKRYETWFSFPECVVALEELLLREGVTILYDSQFSRPIMDGRRCKAILVEEKGGTKAYAAQVFIDATGEASLFQRAGAPTVPGKSLVSYGAHHMSLPGVRKALQTGRVQDALEIKWYGDFPVPGRKRLFPDAVIADARDETDFILKGRSLYLERLHQEEQGCDRGTVLWPSMAMARKIRRIAGAYTLTEADVNQSFHDSVGSICDWRTPGPIYEIPYRVLYGPMLENVLTCGRTISSDGDAWEVTRVIPPAVLTGQAAGTAAALAAAQHCPVQHLDVTALQQQLQHDGVTIHL